MRLGVFDSGIGGITVLNELKVRFPEHEFLYFGDTANVPYGTKSDHQIQNLVTSASLRMKEKHLDALVIACNTASSIAHSHFKAIFDQIPLIDVVAAGVRSILKASESDPKLPVLILGTRATVKSKIYSRLLHEKNPNLEIHEQECPLLVPLIEEGWQAHPVLRLTVEEYVKNHRHLTPGVALLACTHYPWIQSIIEACLPGWKVIDSAHAVADIITEQLGLPSLPSAGKIAKLNWYFSDPDGVTQKIVNFGTAPLQTF